MINHYETQYKLLLNKIMYQGTVENGRNGQVMMLFGQSIGHDMTLGFPVITGRKIFWKKAMAEFRWMWKGETNVQELRDQNVPWWDHWADENGELGPTYGAHIRNFGGYWTADDDGGTDQINECQAELLNEGRRAVLTFWHPDDNRHTKLPPCYTSMTFVRQGEKLHMDFAIRSSDTAVGLPYDMIIGAMFLNEMAAICNLKPVHLRLNLANAHVYENCWTPVEEYLARPMHDLPRFDGDRNIEGYKCEPHIHMPLNV